MMAQELTVYDYQDLIDGSWRRSGCYLYKPDPARTCCPAYTIRLNVGEFVPSKSQKKVLRRLENYLTGKPDTSTSTRKRATTKNTHSTDEACSRLDGCLIECYQSVASENKWHLMSCPSPSVHPVTKKEASAAPRGTLYVSHFPFPLLAFLNKSCVASNMPSNHSNLAQMLVDKVNQRMEDFYVENVLGHLNFSPRPGRTPGTSGLDSSSGNPEIRYASGCSASSAQRETDFGVQNGNDCGGHKLAIQLIRSDMIEEEYQLYKKYQMAIHRDSESKCSRFQYENFLVSSPFTYVSRTEDPEAPECGYGAFHMQYRLDGKLIAVGVVDILPRCLSSKYLFWDPDCASLSLGKLSALKEIDWVKQASSSSPNLKYYYMGFYIHSCQKMAYKGDYIPSELLCPDTHQWVRLTEEVKAGLEANNLLNLVQLSNTATKDNDGFEMQSEDESMEDQLVAVSGLKFCWARAKELLKRYSQEFSAIENRMEEWRKQTGGVGRRIAYHL